MVRPKTHLKKRYWNAMGPWDVSHGPLDQRQTLVALREFLVDIHPLKNIFNVGHGFS